jgi:hypothetical protein
MAAGMTEGRIGGDVGATHSWTNEPLSTEQQHLQDISTLGGFLAPALKLLCHDLNTQHERPAQQTKTHCNAPLGLQPCAPTTKHSAPAYEHSCVSPVLC